MQNDLPHGLISFCVKVIPLLYPASKHDCAIHPSRLLASHSQSASWFVFVEEETAVTLPALLRVLHRYPAEKVRCTAVCVQASLQTRGSLIPLTQLAPPYLSASGRSGFWVSRLRTVRPPSSTTTPLPKTPAPSVTPTLQQAGLSACRCYAGLSVCRC